MKKVIIFITIIIACAAVWFAASKAREFNALKADASLQQELDAAEEELAQTEKEIRAAEEEAAKEIEANQERLGELEIWQDTAEKVKGLL